MCVHFFIIIYRTEQFSSIRIIIYLFSYHFLYFWCYHFCCRLLWLPELNFHEPFCGHWTRPTSGLPVSGKTAQSVKSLSTTTLWVTSTPPIVLQLAWLKRIRRDMHMAAGWQQQVSVSAPLLLPGRPSLSVLTCRQTLRDQRKAS